MYAKGKHLGIKKQFKEARAKSSLTQEQIAEKLFVSRQTISNK